MIANFEIAFAPRSQISDTICRSIESFSSSRHEFSGFRLYLRDETPIIIDPELKDPPDWSCKQCPLWQDLSLVDETIPSSGCWGPFKPDANTPPRISIIQYNDDPYTQTINGNCGISIIPQSK